MLEITSLPRAEFPLAGWASATKRSALQQMLSEASRPGILSFALGLPAAELFPTDAFARSVAHVLANDGRALQYGPPFQPLKAHVVALMAQRGVMCREENVFLTAGAQQGLSLLARLLLEPGGQVLVEEMTYTGFQQVLEPFQPEILTVPTDPDTGIDVDAVEHLLACGKRPSLIYTVADGHNPLGVSMSQSKRACLAELAREYRIPVIEDDPYGFICYGDRPNPPMRALEERWVLYVGSFSKILAPALRVGWIVVPEELIPKLSIIKESSDIDTNTLSQRAITNYLDEQHLPAHLAQLRREYRVRRDTMLSALAEHFPAGARWKEPTSGLFIWVKLPGDVDTGEVLKVAIETEQVAFIPGRAFSVVPRQRGTNCLRLNFSHSSAERTTDGIARLARVLRGFDI
jgi:2-aminoadipate transaminase